MNADISDYTPEQQIELYREEVLRLRAALAAAPVIAPGELDTMVNRFLAWPLPDDVCPDGQYPARVWRQKWGYPLVGTNLLTADQAQSMLLHVLALAPSTARAEQEGTK